MKWSIWSKQGIFIAKVLCSMTEDDKNKKLVCLSCGTIVPLDESVCPNCGSDRHLMQSEQGVSELPKDNPKSPRTRQAALGGFATIALVAFAIILINAVNKPLAGKENSADDIIAATNHVSAIAEEVEKEIVSDLASDEEPDDFEGLVVDGFWYSSHGEWTKAIKAYEKALALRNDDVEVIKELTLTYLETDDVESALFHLNRWADLSPDDPMPHALMGDIYNGQGDLEKAKDEYWAAKDCTEPGDGRMDEYSEKLAEIAAKLDAKQRKAKEAEDGWERVEFPKPVTKPKPEPAEEPKGGITPFSQFFQLQEADPEPDSGFVLIGEGAGDPPGEDKEVADESDVAEAEPEVAGSGEVLLDEAAAEEKEPASVKVTGARFDATNDGFSIYLDTLGHSNPRYFYDEETSVFWLTIPDADCDFTVVPRERTFIHPFVDSIKTWADSEGNIRFKIILKAPIQYSPPTVMGLGLSLHLRKA